MEKTLSDQKIKNMVLQLINAFKIFQIYPPHHQVTQQALDQAFSSISEILQEKGAVYLKFSRNNIVEGQSVILESQSDGERFKGFVDRVLSLGISSLMLFHGLTKTELLTFINMLNKEWSELEKEGGPTGYLSKKDVSHLKINELPKEAEFSESSEASDVTEAKKTRENEILEILSSILLKDNFSQDELRLVGHILSKPKDLRSLLYHISQKGDKKGANIELVERIVLNLDKLITRQKLFSSAEKEGLISAVTSLPIHISGKLVANLIYSSVRSIASKEFLESIAPNQIAGIILNASEKDVVRIEKLCLTIQNVDFDREFKNALVENLKLGLIERGYSAEEAEVIVGLKQTDRNQQEETFTSVSEQDSKTQVLKVSDLEQTPQDIELLEDIVAEAKRFRADSHVFRSMLSLIIYADREDVLNEIRKTIKVIMPSVLENEDFELMIETVDYLKKAMNDQSMDHSKVVFSREILGEIYLEKTIYQIFEKIAGSDMNSDSQAKAIKLLKSLPREHVISALIKILSTEEMLSRRKLLISIIAEVGRENPEIIGKRISASDSKWFLVRNLCTILGLIGKPECIPYLKEASRHADIRVKKEAVKAIAAVGGREAFDAIMEISAGNDADFKRFVLKYIGCTGCREALNILLPVVEKRDFFLRDYQDKLNAIESLSKLPFPEARKALQKLSHTRSLFFRKKAKLISEAAKSALQALHSQERCESNEGLENS